MVFKDHSLLYEVHNLYIYSRPFSLNAYEMFTDKSQTKTPRKECALYPLVLSQTLIYALIPPNQNSAEAKEVRCLAKCIGAECVRFIGRECV